MEFLGKEFLGKLKYDKIEVQTNQEEPTKYQIKKTINKINN